MSNYPSRLAAWTLTFATFATPAVWAADDPADPAPTQFRADEAGWQLRVFGLRFEGFDGYPLANEDGFGVGVSGAYRFSRRAEIEMSLLASEREEDRWWLDDDYHHNDDDLGGLASALVGVNFYMTPDSAVRFYLGPVLGAVVMDERDWHSNYASDDTETLFAIGINLGIDVPFGDSGWAMNASIKILGTESNVGYGNDDLEEISYFTLGAGYRFGR